MEFLRYLPKSYLSWGLGHLARLPLPAPLARLTIDIFTRSYKIDPTLAIQPLSSFNSIGDFFIRDLRPELRPMEGEVVCPVDGTLRWCGNIGESGELLQVKGRNYSVKDLLGSDPLTDRFRAGQCWNFYLSPQDAHHIHSPVDGSIIKSVQVPGKLWPVNDWALSNIDRLFAVNERVISFIESEHGLVAVVMVGATNVGRIALPYCSIETNRAPWAPKISTTIEHSPPITVHRGEKIGTFKMGSSVILLSERQLFSIQSPVDKRKVKYGESLEALSPGS